MWSGGAEEVWGLFAAVEEWCCSEVCGSCGAGVPWTLSLFLSPCKDSRFPRGGGGEPSLGHQCSGLPPFNGPKWCEIHWGYSVFIELLLYAETAVGRELDTCACLFPFYWLYTGLKSSFYYHCKMHSIAFNHLFFRMICIREELYFLSSKLKLSMMVF